MNGNSNGTPICPCGAFQYPAVIFNPAGLSTISYRVGDYTAFRHALLQALPGESELTENVAGTLVQLWRPSADGDLALQMMEWWAYLADVLTFYNERIANQAYLRTADLPESVNRLIQILGYRPQPGIGATGLLAALLSTTKPFTLPKGFQVQSKPGPGKQPQIFELGADTLVQPPDAVAAQPANPVAPLFTSSGSTIVLWLQGTVGSIKPNDRLLLLANEWPASGGFAWLTVVSVAPQKDATGNAVTKLTTSAILQTLPSSAQVTDYQLLKSGQSARLWGFPTTNAVVVGSYETVVFEADKVAGERSDPAGPGYHFEADRGDHQLCGALKRRAPNHRRRSCPAGRGQQSDSHRARYAGELRGPDLVCERRRFDSAAAYRDRHPGDRTHVQRTPVRLQRASAHNNRPLRVDDRCEPGSSSKSGRGSVRSERRNRHP